MKRMDKAVLGWSDNLGISKMMVVLPEVSVAVLYDQYKVRLKLIRSLGGAITNCRCSKSIKELNTVDDKYVSGLQIELVE